MKEIERGTRQKGEALESLICTYNQIVQNKHKLEEEFANKIKAQNCQNCPKSSL